MKTYNGTRLQHPQVVRVREDVRDAGLLAGPPRARPIWLDERDGGAEGWRYVQT